MFGDGGEIAYDSSNQRIALYIVEESPQRNEFFILLLYKEVYILKVHTYVSVCKLAFKTHIRFS